MEEKRFLKDDEICREIKAYVEEDIYSYAIMLDGEWGTGKSYFVEHKLKEMFGEDNDHLNKKFIYVSLYGISSSEAFDAAVNQTYINTVLYNEDKRINVLMRLGIPVVEKLPEIMKAFGKTTGSAIGEKLGEETGKILKKTINENFGDKDGILSKLINFEQCFFVFDDLERCTMPITDVLGYINQFVEHHKCKALIVANEKEIGKSEETPEGEMEKQSYYQKTKEKVIGKTILYRADFDDKIGEIVKDIRDKQEEKWSDREERIITEECTKAIHAEKVRNFRLLYAALAGYNRFRQVVWNLGADNEIKEIMIARIMESMMRVTICSVQEDKDISWNQDAAYSSIDCLKDTNSGNMAEQIRKIRENNFFSFRFVHQYVLSGMADVQMAEKDLKEYGKKLEAERRLDGSTYKKLYKGGWWQYRIDELREIIDQMEEEFLQDEYETQVCMDVIAYDLDINEKLKIGNPDKLFKHFEERVYQKGSEFKQEYQGSFYGIEEQRAVERYRQYSIELYQHNEKLYHEKLETKLNCFGKNDWSQDYEELARDQQAVMQIKQNNQFLQCVKLPELAKAIECGRGIDCLRVSLLFEAVYKDDGSILKFMEEAEEIKYLYDTLKDAQIEDDVNRYTCNQFIEELKSYYERIEGFKKAKQGSLSGQS